MNYDRIESVRKIGKILAVAPIVFAVCLIAILWFIYAPLLFLTVLMFAVAGLLLNHSENYEYGSQFVPYDYHDNTHYSSKVRYKFDFNGNVIQLTNGDMHFITESLGIIFIELSLIFLILLLSVKIILNIPLFIAVCMLIFLLGMFLYASTYLFESIVEAYEVYSYRRENVK